MKIFDKIDRDSLDHREWHLWVLAVTAILVLSVGQALIMYPLAFAKPIVLTGLTSKTFFFAYCALSILLVAYLIERHLMVNRLRHQIRQEEKEIVDIRQEARIDLLESLPRLEHFQDRLAMEFRRAVNAGQPLSLLAVSVKPSGDLHNQTEITATYGEAARTLTHKLRGEDSVYVLASGVFGVMLPGVNAATAARVKERITEGLRRAAGPNGRFTIEIDVTNYPEHAATAREMEDVLRAHVPSHGTPVRPAKPESVSASVQ